MSSSDHDMSESSYLESPQSFAADSPYSSPSQQVPQLATFMTELTCTDKQRINNGNAPFLRVIEQPQNHFRFRYVSEMVGTHGCLLGKSYAINKTKTHPTVELVNYTGQALIRCRLAQNDKPNEHPHKLLEDEQDRDVSYVVPEHGSYKVGFAGMGIIHTAKKDVPGLLFKKMSENCQNYNMKDLKTKCENIARNINLNIVRLRFSAHEIETGKEICSPVFSEPIHNMKSAATNDLKICRISRCSGRPRGGDDVFILVEKVNKKNIMIRFYELLPSGEVAWTATGNFLQSDVHHQYAIVFRTPPYKDPQIGVDVKVYIELVRPSDGRTSEPKEFTYKAEQVFKQAKKRKTNSSYSSLDSLSGGSIKSLSEIPTTVEFMNQQTEPIKQDVDQMFATKQMPVVPQESFMARRCDLEGALLQNTGPFTTTRQPHIPLITPMSGQPIADPVSMSQIPNLNINSSEFEKMLNDTNFLPEDKRLFSAELFSEYLRSYDSVPDQNNSMEFIRSTLVADSGRSKDNTPIKSETISQNEGDNADVTNINTKSESSEYSAFYKSEDGVEVKKLVSELCEVIRNKKGYKKHEVRNKLKKLFDIQLSNGDRFLHMTLCSKQPSFDYIVKIIHSVNMTPLLDLTNYKLQTILHLAVMNDLPKIVTLLVSKGCNPMAKDVKDNNVIHYAVRYQTCLVPLLDAIKNNNVSCDLDVCNGDNQSPLHLAAIYNSNEFAHALLMHGARYDVRDAHGRTPLHLAAYDGNLQVAAALLHYIKPGDVDEVDESGNTALQIVCGRSVQHNSKDFVQLLLEKKADPFKHVENKENAWKLTVDKPELREIVKDLVPSEAIYEDDVKSEPDDDFESADEGDTGEDGGGLEELSMFAREVAVLVDRSGAWRELAKRLHLDALLSWYANQPSPTYTLLNNLKECKDDITCKSLAMILDEMGQHAAAQVIRRYID